MDVAATILFPYAGGCEYAGLAIRSLVAYSRLPLGMVMTVEPGLSDEDNAWVDTLPGRWSGPLMIIRNEFRRGAYGSMNETVRNCPTPVAIWFTSDQVAGPGWDKALLDCLAPNRFVTGRLIESGATLIADRTLWKRFGDTPERFKEDRFVAFCERFSTLSPVDLPRHYIPFAFYVQDFRRMGMFVEGRDTMKRSTYREDFHFFHRCLDAGMQIVEAQQALTYHFQSGSKRSRFSPTGLLNWLYPLGLKWPHRWLTGYVSLIDSLRVRGAQTMLEQVRKEIAAKGRNGERAGN